MRGSSYLGNIVALIIDTDIIRQLLCESYANPCNDLNYFGSDISGEGNRENICERGTLYLYFVKI